MASPLQEAGEMGLTHESLEAARLIFAEGRRVEKDARDKRGLADRAGVLVVVPCKDAVANAAHLISRGTYAHRLHHMGEHPSLTGMRFHTVVLQGVTWAAVQRDHYWSEVLRITLTSEHTIVELP
ncbi:MAG: hypothetical protein WA154_12840 [Moraxellaceae bacterium]